MEKQKKYKFHKATSVSAMDNFSISVHFWDGVTKTYNLKPLFKKVPAFRDIELGKVKIEDAYVSPGGYGIVWNDDIDLSCDEIWTNGQTIKTSFDCILSFADASTIWGLSESTLRKAVKYGKFTKGIDVCKYGKQWLVSRAAMEREYGENTQTDSLAYEN